MEVQTGRCGHLQDEGQTQGTAADDDDDDDHTALLLEENIG